MLSTAIVTALVGVFVVSLAYAWYIAARPIPSGLTWLFVVIGCSFTNVAISVILWDLAHSPAIIWAVWGCYLLSGTPMILSQILKHQKHIHEANRFAENIRKYGRVRRDD